jgi:hypothetical protein
MDHEGRSVQVTDQSRRSWWRLGSIIVIFVFAVGVGMDACAGFPVSRAATSTWKWLLGICGFGALYLLGEGAGDWINSRDKPSDPILRRIVHLLALLGLCGAFLVTVWLIMEFVS